MSTSSARHHHHHSGQGHPRPSCIIQLYLLCVYSVSEHVSLPGTVCTLCAVLCGHWTADKGEGCHSSRVLMQIIRCCIKNLHNTPTLLLQPRTRLWWTLSIEGSSDQSGSSSLFTSTDVDIIYYLHYTLFYDPSVQSQRVTNIASDISH